MSQTPDIHKILDLARWAPSGDNTQPWRFQIEGPWHVVVHGFDTREHCVYDLDGHPSQISMGALIETAAIAASTQGLTLEAIRRADTPEHRPLVDLRFSPSTNVQPDHLAASIQNRSVQRRPLSTRPLQPEELAALAASVGPHHRVAWMESFSARLRVARMLFHSAKLRLIMREAYEVHRDIIEWNARYSETRVPDQALGADAVTTKLMRFAMTSWERIDFMNRYLAGTVAPRIQLDFIPGLACASHFAIQAERAPRGIDDYIAAGRAMQRFWLTATSLGIQLQPEITPLVFARYARERRDFSKLPAAAGYAQQIEARLATLLGGAPVAERTVFMGRVGKGAAASARSLRRPLDELMLTPGSNALSGSFTPSTPATQIKTTSH